MKQVIELIKQRISECKKSGDMFNLPSFNRDDVKVKTIEHETGGNVLYSCEYQILFSDGSWINIETQSKDKCRTFQINPDRSSVIVTCSDSSLNFTDSWDENN